MRVQIQRTSGQPTAEAAVRAAGPYRDRGPSRNRVSLYQRELEIADYELDGSSLALHLPQSGKRTKIRVRAWKCSGYPPFDRCLELDGQPWA